MESSPQSEANSLAWDLSLRTFMKKSRPEILNYIKIGKSWEENSSLEKWFPITAEELNKLREENKKLREGLSLVARNIGNGSFALPDASIDFLTKEVPEEVRLVVRRLKYEQRNSKNIIH